MSLFVRDERWRKRKPEDEVVIPFAPPTPLVTVPSIPPLKAGFIKKYLKIKDISVYLILKDQETQCQVNTSGTKASLIACRHRKGAVKW